MVQLRKTASFLQLCPLRQDLDTDSIAGSSALPADDEIGERTTRLRSTLPRPDPRWRMCSRTERVRGSDSSQSNVVRMHCERAAEARVEHEPLGRARLGLRAAPSCCSLPPHLLVSLASLSSPLHLTPYTFSKNGRYVFDSVALQLALSQPQLDLGAGTRRARLTTRLYLLTAPPTPSLLPTASPNHLQMVSLALAPLQAL